MRALSCWKAAAPSLLLATLAAAVAPGALAAEPPASFPVLAVDPLPRGTVMESHADALPHWIGQGITDAVLLHVDAVGGMGDPGAENVAALRALQQGGDVGKLFAAGRSGAAGLFRDGNYLRAAAGLGVVRDVVWVIPFALPREGESEEDLKTFLGPEGLSPGDVATFRPVDGCYRGSAGSLPVRICDLEHLPRLDTPVLLSVASDFFPAAAEFYGFGVPATIKVLFAALRAQRYAVRDAAVVSSMQAEEWPIELRWLSDAVLEALRDPGLTLRDEPPERWRHLEKLFLLKRGGAAAEGELLNLSLSLLEQWPHDPAFLLFAAEASAAHGGGSAALSYAEQACSVDPGYCVGLRELGLAFCDAGKCETGGRFFAAGERLRPGMTYRQYDLGIALWKSGRSAEALAALEQLVRYRGAWPGGFVVGAMHAALGDRPAARRFFDEAVAALDGAATVAATRPEVADAVARAAAFYREEGQAQTAERLESDARLRWEPPQPGP